jgi:hypothetical protein
LRIAGLPPVLQQALLAALPKVGETLRSPVAPAEASVPQMTPVAIPGPATSVQMLVALAAPEPTIDRRRKTAERAEKGVSMLERLHAELALGAEPDPERLQELVDWAESFKAPEDPVLAGLSREIELRVRVEIAKLEMRV